MTSARRGSRLLPGRPASRVLDDDGVFPGAAPPAAAPWLLALGSSRRRDSPAGYVSPTGRVRGWSNSHTRRGREASRAVAGRPPRGLQPGVLVAERHPHPTAGESRGATPPGHGAAGRLLLFARREGDRRGPRGPPVGGGRGSGRLTDDRGRCPTGPGRGGSWSRDGVILVSVAGAIHRVKAAGWALDLVLAPEKDRFSWHGWPFPSRTGSASFSPPRCGRGARTCRSSRSRTSPARPPPASC